VKPRIIDPSFWEDLDVIKLSRDERLLMTAMITAGADDYGRLKANGAYLKRLAFAFDDDLTVADTERMILHIGQCCKNVQLYEVNGERYACFTNWLKYQGIKYQSKSVIPEPTLANRIQDFPTLEKIGEPEPIFPKPSPSRVGLGSVGLGRVGLGGDSGANAPGDESPAPETPPAPKRANPKSDPRSQSPAIQAAKRVNNGRYPPQALYGPILDALGDAPDVGRMTECRQAWLSRGYNPNAWTWLLEWYRDGIPKNGKARASPGDGGKMPKAFERLKEIDAEWAKEGAGET
jgi:hypothetical protein